jgi:septum formation protein
LLASLGIPFEVVVAAVVEHEDSTTEPRTMVAHNAAMKAEWGAARYPEATVLAADTTVCIDNQALNKPRDLAEARGMLLRLGGRTHTVFTGIAVRRRADALALDEGVASEVTFRPLDARTIDDYLARVNPLDKAGGYAIQEHGEMIVASYSGSFTNIVGLPLEATKQILTRCGYQA